MNIEKLLKEGTVEELLSINEYTCFMEPEEVFVGGFPPQKVIVPAREFGEGFAYLFWNPNLIKLPTVDIIRILEILKAKKQRCFSHTYYHVLSFDEEVRHWVIKNLEPISSNELYISDDENY